jgi:hypothetical protein
MKHFLSSLYVMLVAFTLTAQKADTPFTREINFGTGIGLSLFPSVFNFIEFGTDGSVKDTRSSAAYTGYIEFRPRHFFSFGLAGGTQYVEQTVTDFSYTVDDKNYFIQAFDYRVVRTNLGIYAGIHYVNQSNLDLYSNVRTGLSIFSIQLNINDEVLLNELVKRAKFALSTPALQMTLIGVRYYPIPYLGLHVEAGLGAPAFLMGGLSFRIPAGPSKT